MLVLGHLVKSQKTFWTSLELELRRILKTSGCCPVYQASMLSSCLHYHGNTCRFCYCSQWTAISNKWKELTSKYWFRFSRGLEPESFQKSPSSGDSHCILSLTVFCLLSLHELVSFLYLLSSVRFATHQGLIWTCLGNYLHMSH